MNETKPKFYHLGKFSSFSSPSVHSYSTSVSVGTYNEFVTTPTPSKQIIKHWFRSEVYYLRSMDEATSYFQPVISWVSMHIKLKGMHHFYTSRDEKVNLWYDQNRCHIVMHSDHNDIAMLFKLQWT